ncbi:hypothetical protein CERSUDRAFT_114442 [Gelatoporia subvermispora B]|uniref:Yeast cell wall synthesis Kre9/Knh1-like N-terminal domain-containing protein n=1 Tax=Ceriporiopsis subvermispora (strain B) TaxID=914234 RepID=M2QL67_CERS8|nr:hypothetical protein CERSUDRAFT_114442 [Gelatoporia subvermispora B]
MRSIFVPLLLAGLAFGYVIVTPNSESGWTTEGPNAITWTKLATDPPEFSIILQSSIVGGIDELAIASGVDGNTGIFVVPPQEEGFPAGDGFHIDFVNATNNSDIFAQSAPFSIIQSN